MTVRLPSPKLYKGTHMVTWNMQLPKGDVSQGQLEQGKALLGLLPLFLCLCGSEKKWKFRPTIHLKGVSMLLFHLV